VILKLKSRDSKRRRKFKKTTRRSIGNLRDGKG
jgi:hypothetical protein